MLCLGNLKEAAAHLEQTGRLLSIRGIVDSNDLTVMALAEAAALMLARDEPSRALALATFVANHPASWHETRWRAEEISASASAALNPAESSAAEEEARELTLDQAQAWAGWE
jgi:hypothetical protein